MRKLLAFILLLTVSAVSFAQTVDYRLGTSFSKSSGADTVSKYKALNNLKDSISFPDKDAEELLKLLQETYTAVKTDSIMQALNEVFSEPEIRGLVDDAFEGITDEEKGLMFFEQIDLMQNADLMEALIKMDEAASDLQNTDVDLTSYADKFERILKDIIFSSDKYPVMKKFYNNINKNLLGLSVEIDRKVGENPELVYVSSDGAFSPHNSSDIIILDPEKRPVFGIRPGTEMYNNLVEDAMERSRIEIDRYVRLKNSGGKTPKTHLSKEEFTGMVTMSCVLHLVPLAERMQKIDIKMWSEKGMAIRRTTLYSFRDNHIAAGGFKPFVDVRDAKKFNEELRKAVISLLPEAERKIKFLEAGQKLEEIMK
ncbi:hypothetical protein Dip518_001066 [Parelusimicrobium proximum]|uniref:hypothetical protein n=1 Tax=Parelusimicrobium proximum TaxID=3228953 RepID=UPI003D176721